MQAALDQQKAYENSVENLTKKLHHARQKLQEIDNSKTAKDSTELADYELQVIIDLITGTLRRIGNIK